MRYAVSHSKLAVVEICVETVPGKELLVVSLFDDVTVFHDEDNVRFANGGKAVCNDETRPAFHHLRKGVLYLYFGTGIYRGSRFVKYQHRRQAEHYAGDAEKLLLSL